MGFACLSKTRRDLERLWDARGVREGRRGGKVGGKEARREGVEDGGRGSEENVRDRIKE